MASGHFIPHGQGPLHGNINFYHFYDARRQIIARGGKKSRRLGWIRRDPPVMEQDPELACAKIEQMRRIAWHPLRHGGQAGAGILANIFPYPFVKAISARIVISPWVSSVLKRIR